jgi:Holliday junction resolvasome RuvABC endonuclease subunit
LTAPPVLIGFDLATQVGWCAGDGSRSLVVGSFRLPATGANVGAYLLEARTFFRIVLQRFRPAHVVYEAPVRVENQALQIKLHGLPGILEMECVERGITVAMVYPSTIKAKLAGHGHAKKPAMILAARRLCPNIENADEADAVGAWLCGLTHYSPDLWPAWERRLRGAELD